MAFMKHAVRQLQFSRTQRFMLLKVLRDEAHDVSPSFPSGAPCPVWRSRLSKLSYLKVYRPLVFHVTVFRLLAEAMKINAQPVALFKMQLHLARFCETECLRQGKVRRIVQRTHHLILLAITLSTTSIDNIPYIEERCHVAALRRSRCSYQQSLDFVRRL